MRILNNLEFIISQLIFYVGVNVQLLWQYKYGAFLFLYQARSNKQMNLVLRTFYQGPGTSHGQGAKHPGPSLPKYTNQGHNHL
jgi:hypothetical protein